YAPLIRKVKEGTREEAIFSVAFDDWILTFDAKADRPPDEATSIEWSFSKFVAESEVFYAHYNITTVSALDEAREAGKLIYCNYNSTFNWDKVPMVNYDDGWYFFSGIGAYGEFIQLSCNNESGWHSNVFTMPSEYDDTPSALGTASAGSSHGQYALGDHVHPLPSPRDIGVVKIFKYDVAFSADIESAYQSGASVWVQYNDWFYPLVYRGSATIHYFAGYGEDNVRVIMCTQDTWDVGDGRIPGAAINNINLPHDLGTKSVGSSLRYARADHVHQMPSASDVGAIASPSSPSVGDFLVYTANGWAAQTLAEWQGGSY
ncbi:MAG: hypothetical protein J5725_12025, partial [Bacteroidales bacterium]|nr:hypothetical protein [Bacteroidales bacterium]